MSDPDPITPLTKGKAGLKGVLEAQHVIRRRQRDRRSKHPLWGTIDHAFSALPGGRFEGLAYLQMAANAPDPPEGTPQLTPLDRARRDRLRLVMEKWGKLKISVQNSCSLDQLCRDVGCDPAEALGEAVKWGARYNADLSQFVAASCMPKVVRAVAKRAQGRNGHQDARIIGEATGWIPTSRGVSINNQFLAGATVRSQVGGGVDTGGLALPSFDSDTVTTCEEQRGSAHVQDAEVVEDADTTP